MAWIVPIDGSHHCSLFFHTTIKIFFQKQGTDHRISKHGKGTQNKTGEGHYYSESYSSKEEAVEESRQESCQRKEQEPKAKGESYRAPSILEILGCTNGAPLFLMHYLISFVVLETASTAK